MVAARKAVDDYMRGTVSRAEAQAKLDGLKAKPWFKYLYLGEPFRDRDVSGRRKEIENDPLRNLKAVTVPTLILFAATYAIVPVAPSATRFPPCTPPIPTNQLHLIT